MKYKKAGKSLEEIGERWYGFDFNSERIIYCYLCCCRGKKRKLKKLDKKLRFESYQQWKQYIWNRYENFDKEMLIEFSRYLNLRIRYIAPTQEYWSIAAAAMLTLVLTKLIDAVDINWDISEVPVGGIIVFGFLLELLFMLALAFIIMQTLYPIFDNSVDENFLKDYKEIVDEIIRNKIEEQ